MQTYTIPCRRQRNHKQTNEDKWNRPMRSAHISNRASTRQGKTSQEQQPTLTPWWRDVESPCRIEQSQLHHVKTPRHLCRGSSTKIAMQRLRRCSQLEDSRSFHAAEEMQPSVIKHARQRCGEAASHAATQSKDQPKKATVSHDPFHEETWKCSQSCIKGPVQPYTLKQQDKNSIGAVTSKKNQSSPS